MRYESAGNRLIPVTSSCQTLAREIVYSVDSTVVVGDYCRTKYL